MSYHEIEDYALVGDCHGCALISKTADVDWLTLKRFDNDPSMWRILDDEKGGFIRIHFPKSINFKRNYLQQSNILQTIAYGSDTEIILTDFMPVGRNSGSKTHDYTSLKAFHGLVRKIESKGLEQKITIEFKSTPWPGTNKTLNFYVGGKKLNKVIETNLEVTITQGEPLYIVVSHDEVENLSVFDLEQLELMTKSFWKEWSEYCQYQGPYKQLIERSALALKMLIHAPSGAIMAAPTTSLPEIVPGSRNWDYRYSWLRDSSFTLYALAYLGYSGEADRYAEFIERIVSKSSELKVLYSIDGESNAPEKCHYEIKGYKSSSPVRTGNGADGQLQLDTYGEFLDWAYLHKSLGGNLSASLIAKVKDTAEFVLENWRKKDKGIWEVRSQEENFTYSKVMCWVALDRAASLLQDTSLYVEDKKEIERYIQSFCTSPEGILKRSAECEDLDASLLLLKTVGYPVSDEVYHATIQAIRLHLSDGHFVMRYKTHDGLNEKEGYFLICSFWLVNALLFTGQYQEARKMFNMLTSSFNDVGLLSEEIDGEKLSFLGNFPQALSHLAFIETASYFEIYEKYGKEGLKGCHGDRVRKMHKTLHGPKAVWNFVIKTKNFRKLFPSNESIYPNGNLSTGSPN